VSTMTDTNTLIAARKKAEDAVEGMPDGELKVEAFKIILNRLLAGGDTPTGAKKQRSGGSASSEADSSGDAQNMAPRSAPARILALKAEGFFDEQRGIGEVKDELQTHGWIYDMTALSGTLIGLVQKRELRRVKVNDGKKTTYKYFNP
jgi:hypothetical protein